MSNTLMCHVVAGYPDDKSCMKLLQGMNDLGVEYIEIQIPFSDPIADGESIMEANDVALKNDMTIARSFNLVEAFYKQAHHSNVFIMTYAQKVYHVGHDLFCKKASIAHVKGLIIPDLPYDTQEFRSLKKAAKKYNISIVPVVSPGMDSKRLDSILALEPEFVYLTSQRGITGKKYASSKELNMIAADIKKRFLVKLMIGFGIQSSKDVADVLSYGDVAVIGSVIVRSLQSGSVAGTIALIKELKG